MSIINIGVYIYVISASRPPSIMVFLSLSSLLF